MSRIADAPSGEDSSIDGTEKIPVSASKWTTPATIAAYIRTLTQTLTGKTINLTDNTLTGTKAQFNTAMSDADFATLTGSETLTNKTLTTPTIADFTNAQHDHGDADDGGLISGSSSDSFKTIVVSGQSDVVADSATDTLTIVAGTGVTITTNAGADSLTIAQSAGVGLGDFVGPGSSTDNAVVRFDSTTGKLGQNSVMTVDDSGTVNIPTGQTYKIDGTAHTHAGGSSVVVQHVSTQTGAVATGTTLIPFDDTIPQSGEGIEFMTLAITPTSATNILYIDVTIQLSHSVAAWVAVALFQDSTANALAAIVGYQDLAGAGMTLQLRHKMVAGTTSATTFKARGGGQAAGTTTFNGQNTGRIYGGVMASSITITELTP